MGKFADAIRGFFTRKPLPPDEAEDISGWVNEGGTYDPAGPPPIMERPPVLPEEDTPPR